MKRLLLLGGGHAHVRVLDRLARDRLQGWEVVLLTAHPQALYSGMLPGWVAGHYRLDQCAIDLSRLAAAAGARLLVDEAQALDVGARQVRTARHGPLAWDVLSLDVGSGCLRAGIAGADEHATPVRPAHAFVSSWERLLARAAAARRPLQLVIVGAGPGGVELAFAVQQRGLRERSGRFDVHLVGADPRPLPAAAAAVQDRVLEHLQQRGIHWHGSRSAVAATGDAVELTGGEVLRADACWLVTGPAAHAWLAESGLDPDPRGFVRVGDTLQSRTHPDVFAAGDAASHPVAVPRSGVYAVRAGAVLARNLLAHCTGKPLASWTPPARALYLLSTADGRAIALWGGLHGESGWLWTLKDRIDRRFVRVHSR